MPIEGFNQLLLSIQRQGSEAPLLHCKERLLAALRLSIAFDCAIWSSGTDTPQLVFRSATIDFPTDRLLAYAPWQPHDALRAAANARPGTALRNEDVAPLEDHYASDIYRNFGGPNGLEHTLAIADVDPQTRVGELIFLFRSARDQPFTDPERDVLALALPHLMLAWRHRLLWEFALGAERPLLLSDLAGEGRAVIDPSGHVHASDGAFGLAMRAAFPAWVGPRLPGALITLIDGDHALLKIGGHMFRLIKGLDRHLLRQPSPGLAALTPAELKVATLFASGFTAPAVAGRLNLSTLTVRNHLTSVYQKLGIHSKAALARMLEHNAR
jgi:DNA-binding CsgD family transcriptional regulator